MLVLPFVACPEPKPADSGDTDTPGDTDTALVVGLVHREAAEACPLERPLTPAPGSCATNEASTCTANSDCTAGENGRCYEVPDGSGCDCAYDECTSDADCGATGACMCAEHLPTGVNTCAPADCHTDADCAEGYCFVDRLYCGETTDPDALWWYGYTCATAGDTCRSDDDCTSSGDYCVYDGAAWSCSGAYAMSCE
jgi:hypothetical protein